MTDYTKTVDFAAKDALASGNPAKVGKGVEVNTELVNIATAIASKYDAGDTVLTADGTLPLPGIAFSSDTDTGFYHPSANQMNAAAGGVAVMEFGSLFVNADVPLRAADGLVGTPSISFWNDTNTGIYRVGTDSFSLVGNGASQLLIDGSSSVGVRSAVAHSFVAGSAATPSINFSSSSFNTGFFNDTASQIAISLGGTKQGAIATGSFTITYVGFTVNPTATAQWMKVGHTVTLFLPATTGTSNNTNFTASGLPALITPAGSDQVIALPWATDSGSVVNNVSLQISVGGTLTFRIAGVAANWTASGTKALPIGMPVTYLVGIV